MTVTGLLSIEVLDQPSVGGDYRKFFDGWSSNQSILLLCSR